MFKKPEKPHGITFMLRGEPGTGKTRFALGLSRITGKPVAVIGNDRGAALYSGDPAFGECVCVEVRDAETIDAAIRELVSRAAAFGGVVIDTITDWWNLTQKRHEVEREGKRVVPMRAWRQIRDEHECRIRAIQASGLHAVLVAEDRPVYERIGEELREVGTREDTDSRDAYVVDVRLRMFSKDGRPYAEILKDRTGRFAMGAVVEDPSIEMWLGVMTTTTYDTRQSPKKKAHPLEGLAGELIDHIGEIQDARHWANWRRKHAKTLAALFKALPESDTRKKLVAIAKAKKIQFERNRA